MADKLTLKDYAQARPPKGPVCAICLLDPEIRDQIDEALCDGARKVIVEWMKQEYPETPITGDMLDHHKQSQHHLGEECRKP